MVKVRALKRAPDALERESRGDLRQSSRNLDPQFDIVREAAPFIREVKLSRLAPARETR